MTLTFAAVRQEIIQLVLCCLVSILFGGFLLLDLPAKWEIALLGALGTIALMVIVQSPKRILLFMVPFTLPYYVGKAFVVRPEYLGLTRGVDINLSDVLALTLLLLLLANLALRQVEMHFFPLITIPALGWIIVSALSLLAARDTELTIFELIRMGKLLFFCWVIANSVGNEVDVICLLTGLVLGIFAQALVGVNQGVTGHPLGLYLVDEISGVARQGLGEALINRVRGTLGHPNAYALYVTAGTPFLLPLLLSRVRNPVKALAATALCVDSLALMFSLSRSAWVIFLVVVTVVLGLAVRSKRISSNEAILVAGATSLIIAALTLLGPDIILSRLTSSDRGSAYSRITLSEGALAMIQDHPLVGVGLNNYSLLSPYYDPIDLQSQHKPPIVHNAFLLVAAETGLVGLAAWVGFLAIMVIQAWQIVDRAPTDILWVASVGIFAALVAMTLRSMVDYDLLSSLPVFSQFWLFVGLSTALRRRLDLRQKDFGQVSSRAHPTNHDRLF